MAEVAFEQEAVLDKFSVVENRLSFSPSAEVRSSTLVFVSFLAINNGSDVLSDVLWSAVFMIWDQFNSIGEEAVHSAFSLRGTSWALLPALWVSHVH